MLTLYLQKVPSSDLGNQTLPPSKAQRDVYIYKDAEATKAIGRYPWHYRKPTRRNRRIMFNCVERPVIWLPDETVQKPFVRWSLGSV